MAPEAGEPAGPEGIPGAEAGGGDEFGAGAGGGADMQGIIDSAYETFTQDGTIDVRRRHGA
jgi:hypothetical protein